MQKSHFLLCPKVFAKWVRFATTAPVTKSRSRKMTAWQINSYGDLDEVQSHNLNIPAIRSPTEVLCQVLASSVNPIDVAMVGGYGASLLNKMRCQEIEFPLVLGRDFVGVVVNKGNAVTDVKLGDKVFGVVPVHRQGCHAEYVNVERSCVATKPTNTSDLDASSVLYAALTAWSGIFVTGQLTGVCGHKSYKNKKALVLGAAGGVGSMALQMLVAEGAHVFATCASDAVTAVQNLNANTVLDYTSATFLQDVASAGPYDLILDCAGRGSSYAAEVPWKFEQYITFSSPLLKNLDSYGFVAGLARNVSSLVQDNVRTATTNRGSVKWGYFMPAPQGISYVKSLMERGKLQPVVQDTFTFQQTKEAYKRVQDGHLRGKIVIDHTK
jgi:reticulon-4-interacting protein 1, mitochondrial